MNYHHEIPNPSAEDLDRFYSYLMNNPDQPRSIHELALVEDADGRLAGTIDSGSFAVKAVWGLMKQGLIEIANEDQVKLRLPVDEA